MIQLCLTEWYNNWIVLMILLNDIDTIKLCLTEWYNNRIVWMILLNDITYDSIMSNRMILQLNRMNDITEWYYNWIVWMILLNDIDTIQLCLT